MVIALFLIQTDLMQVHNDVSWRPSTDYKFKWSQRFSEEILCFLSIINDDWTVSDWSFVAHSSLDHSYNTIYNITFAYIRNSLYDYYFSSKYVTPVAMLSSTFSIPHSTYFIFILFIMHPRPLSLIKFL